MGLAVTSLAPSATLSPCKKESETLIEVVGEVSFRKKLDFFKIFVLYLFVCFEKQANQKQKIQQLSHLSLEKCCKFLFWSKHVQH